MTARNQKSETHAHTDCLSITFRVLRNDLFSGLYLTAFVSIVLLYCTVHMKRSQFCIGIVRRRKYLRDKPFLLPQQERTLHTHTSRAGWGRKPHSPIPACLGWKNAALLAVKRSNGHLINLSCLNLLSTILPVTPFNSLMTLLSIRLRRTESKHDLIKRVHMFKTVPTKKQKHLGFWEWQNWPRYWVSKWHAANNKTKKAKEKDPLNKVCVCLSLALDSFCNQCPVMQTLSTIWC